MKLPDNSFDLLGPRPLALDPHLGGQSFPTREESVSYAFQRCWPLDIILGPRIGKRSEASLTNLVYIYIYTYIYTVRVEQLAPREVSSAKKHVKTKNGLKWVQFSPIWTKLCQNFANMISKKNSKPEGPRQSNKGVNEDFFSKKKLIKGGNPYYRKL